MVRSSVILPERTVQTHLGCATYDIIMVGLMITLLFMITHAYNVNKYDNSITCWSVLETKRPRGGLNRGFRTMDHKVITYEQSRDALPYLYIKRKVGPDGVSTTPLDI